MRKLVSYSDFNAIPDLAFDRRSTPTSSKLDILGTVVSSLHLAALSLHWQLLNVRTGADEKVGAQFRS